MIKNKIVDPKEIEIMSEMGFAFMKNQRENNKKYEQKLKELIMYLIQNYKQIINKKMSQKMKDTQMLAKIVYIFRGSQEVKSVFRNIIEKYIKE